MIFDSTIRTYRDKKGISQQKLADLLKLPRTTVSFYETKRQLPDLKTAEKIARILETIIGKLYTPEELNVISSK
ncbi:XRE family transcriptional regulator [Candidatus Atribacteria bacterium 1244-E10-H5-B2]|nr:MAG: XRE family transcriptional regulator [Candidatus Atribacteria bacterium 1244-E10-H5-B2]